MTKQEVNGRGGQVVGYVRVSSTGQNTARQLEGVEMDKVFEERASAKDAKRPVLQECLDYLRAGDVLAIHSMDRLARNLRDLEELVEGLNKREINVRFVKESLTFTGSGSGADNPMQKLMLQLLGAVAQFERSLIRERQLEGIAIAKREGKYKGRKRALTDSQVDELRQRRESGESATALAKEYGISRETLYASLRQ